MLAHLKQHCTWLSLSRLQLINKSKTLYRIIQQKSHFCDESKNRPNLNDSALKETTKKPIISPNVETKYNLFTDDSTIILDIEEEREKLYNQTEAEPHRDGKWIIPKHISRERGITGVFDIDELVEVLKSDNAKDICVLAIPAELKYVDYICVVTGKSYRHMNAMSEFVRKMYKVKRNSKDLLPKIEGKDSKDWIALDLGNIALHIFSEETRIKYDIEQLWAVGTEYDEQTNMKEDSILELFNQHFTPLAEKTNK